jgi:hypothetical protein
MLGTWTPRRAWRFSISGTAEYLGPNGVGTAKITNVSRDGWRLEGHHGLQAGMALSLCARLSGNRKSVKAKKAVVRWMSGTAFGVYILEMTPLHRRWHHEYLSSHLDRLLR